MKSIIKKILLIFLKRENKKISSILNTILKNKFHMLDIGAAEGINNRWKLIESKIYISLAEPHKNSAKNLKKMGYNVIEKILYSEKKSNLIFYETRKPLCSSTLKPNFKHLNKYPEPERFEVINQSNLEASTIDDEFKINEVPSFVKIDTEGAELEILKGSKKSLKNILGIEIECEFFKLRENQPLFEEIINFLKTYNFEFIDFINIIRWERKDHRFTGQPQVADVLFLKTPELVLEDFKKKLISEETFLYYFTILVIYNRSDIINLLINNLNKEFVDKFKLKELYSLVEKKVKRLNKVEKYTWFFKSGINNII